MNLTDAYGNFQKILDFILLIEDGYNNKRVQKRKFRILTKLVSFMFKNKNSRHKFQNITSLIILFLNFQKKSYPVDVFTETLDTYAKKADNKIKDILKNELLVKKNWIKDEFKNYKAKKQ